MEAVRENRSADVGEIREEPQKKDELTVLSGSEDESLSGEDLDRKFLEMGVPLDLLNKARRHWQKKSYSKTEREIIFGERSRVKDDRSFWTRLQSMEENKYIETLVESFLKIGFFACFLSGCLSEFGALFLSHAVLSIVVGCSCLFIVLALSENKNTKTKKKFEELKDKRSKYKSVPGIADKIDDEIIEFIENDFHYIPNYFYTLSRLSDVILYERSLKVQQALLERCKIIIDETESFQELFEFWNEHKKNGCRWMKETNQQLILHITKRMEALGCPVPKSE